MFKLSLSTLVLPQKWNLSELLDTGMWSFGWVWHNQQQIIIWFWWMMYKQGYAVWVLTWDYWTLEPEAESGGVVSRISFVGAPCVLAGKSEVTNLQGPACRCYSHVLTVCCGEVPQITLSVRKERVIFFSWPTSESRTLCPLGAQGCREPRLQGIGWSY